MSIPFNAPTEGSKRRRLRKRKHKPEGIVSSQKFDYSPLPSTNSVRLLTLQSFNHKYPGRVCCTLHVRSFTLAPQDGLAYTALSYVWGKAKNLEPIQLDNVQVMVQPNLYHALLELSKDSFRPLLWVDALCINQADIHERNAQVAIMKDIYSNATQVVVWLGRGNVGIIKWHHELLKWLGFQEECFISNFYDCTEVGEWFHRCWTLQELMLAKTAMVRCGQDVIAWERLVMIMDEEGGHASFRGLHPQDAGRARARANSVVRLQNLVDKFRSGHLTLTQILVESSRRRSSEPTDMVFSVMGLFPEPPVAIDYSKDLCQLCKAATLACIAREKNLYIIGIERDFHVAEDTIEKVRDLGYPSWTVQLPVVSTDARKEARRSKRDSTTRFSLESVQDELIAQIISEPDIAILPLTGHLLGRIRPTNKSVYHHTLDPIPSCAVTATTTSQSVTETTVLRTRKACNTFGPLLQLLQRHDELLCDGPEVTIQGASNSDDDEFGEDWSCRIKFGNRLIQAVLTSGNSRLIGGDWLCRIKGGNELYFLRPMMSGHLRLIGVMYKEFVKDLYGGFPEVEGRIEESYLEYAISKLNAGGWPVIEVDLPLG